MHEHNNEQDSRTIVPQDTFEGHGRDDVTIANLVGYFDVLIQMDIEQKRKEHPYEPKPVTNKSVDARVDESHVERGSITGRKAWNRGSKSAKE